jgi:RNA polymerase sigma-54 factor
MSLSLEQKLSQQLHLSPQMQQSLQVLQAPMMELQHLVRQEVEANPVLEAEVPEVSLEEARLEERLTDDFDSEFSRLSQMDDEWRNYLSQSASGLRGSRSAEDEEQRQFLFDSLTSEPTLQEHLLEQLLQADAFPEVKEHAATFIGSLDDRGWLTLDIEEFALEQGLVFDEVEDALALLQSMEPAGVGAKTLQECLLLQLRRDGREHSLEARIIQNHFEDLAMHRFAVMSRKLGVGPEVVSKAAEQIAQLNPRPSAGFNENKTVYVKPDASLEWTDDGYVVVMNDEQLPRLRISNHYKDLMAQGAGAEVRDYIKSKIQSGKFFIRSIQQRQETIQKIAQIVVDRQADFMKHGKSQLRPMTMAQVAEVVGVHETTVSRAVNGKYLETPQGVYELKYFFSSGYETESGAGLAKTSVKEALREVVAGESSASPMNDEQIMEELAKRGMKIARRTVAKYRDELGILPVNLRRR